MDILVNAAVWFIGIFQQSAEVFKSLVVGIIPLVIVLMTAFNAIVAWIGSERIDRLGAAAGKEGIGGVFLRYLILPVVSVFVLTNPMAYTMGRFLPEKFKPGFYDAAVSYVHPPLGIFPHVNPGELFVWLGIATGVSTGYGPESMANLAVRYLLVGLVVIFIRGLVTERIYKTLTARKAAGEAAGEG